jgi:tRNA-Thr(GGU) m(6)t(6)A37 methyltransferase TsaA
MFLEPIGIIHSPFKEKFTIPRQPGLISIPCTLELTYPFGSDEALLGLENFSHIWVIFHFHKIDNVNKNFKGTVRPPRLGGNVRQGVFATRSPYRANNIGLSLVKIISIEKNKITVVGGDFLDQTPILDIKPYIKEIESVTDANSAWTDSIVTKKLEVIFEEKVKNQLNEMELVYLTEILSLDPRPSFHNEDKKTYAAKIFDYDVHWKIQDNVCIVFSLASQLLS